MAISVGNAKFTVNEQDSIYFLNLTDKNIFAYSDGLLSKILFENKINIKQLISKAGDYIYFSDGWAIFRLNVINNHLEVIYASVEEYDIDHDRYIDNITKIVLNVNKLYFFEFNSERIKRIDIDGTNEKLIMAFFITDFTINKNNLHIMETPDCKITLDYTWYEDGEIKIWTISDGLSFDTDGSKLYYLTNDVENFGSDYNFIGSKIHCLDLATKDKSVFFDDIVKSFIISGNDMYYINSTENFKLYYYNVISKSKKKMCDVQNVVSINYTDEWIYFCAKDNNIYKIKSTGEECSKIV